VAVYSFKFNGDIGELDDNHQKKFIESCRRMIAHLYLDELKNQDQEKRVQIEELIEVEVKREE
jgi:hypothetical protein